MTTKHSARHRDSQGDGGYTLIELTVSTTLMMIVSAALMFAYIHGLKASTQAQDKVTTALEAKTASDNLTKALRTAVTIPGVDHPIPAFRTAGPREVEFYAAMGNRNGPKKSLDTPPVKVRLFVDGTSLKISTVPPDGNTYAWNGTPVTRILATDVAPGQIFTYLKSSDLVANGDPVSSLTLDANGAVPTGALANIRAVKISLSLDTGKTERSTPTTVTSLVTLLNT